MKANSIVATLLVVAAVHADARFASPYPRKAVAPDASGGWIAITNNAWSHNAESESHLRRTIIKEVRTGQLKTGMFHSASPPQSR